MKGDLRCIEGRLFRHDPQHDDPDLETDVGQCPDCEGDGCMRFDVDIWNFEGDVVKAFYDKTPAEVDAIRDQYADDPTLSVVVNDR